MNENQKIVLNYLKKVTYVNGNQSPMWSIKKLIYPNISSIYVNLTTKEEFEILAEFAKWGLKNEKNTI